MINWQMVRLSDFLKFIESYQKNDMMQLLQRLNLCSSLSMIMHEEVEKEGIYHIVPFNLIDYNGLIETQTSQIIAQFLSYQKKGKYPIWESFLQTFIPELSKKVERPIFTAEQQRIDICVKEKTYVVIFENKLKDTVFQRNQLGRYIRKMYEEGFSLNQIFVVIFPGHIDSNFIHSIRPSAWCAPKDWKSANNIRKCREDSSSDVHACWCDNKDWKWNKNEWCKQCDRYWDLLETEKLLKHIIVIDSRFTEWLISTCSSTIFDKEILLRSAAIQFADYIKGIYNIRLNKQEIMANIKVLEKELCLDPHNPEEGLSKVDNLLSDVNEIQQSLKSLRDVLRIRIWQQEIENEFPQARVDSDGQSFGILIEGVYCGIWIEDNKYYWGFYISPNKIQSDNTNIMVQKILAKTPSCNSKGSSQNFIAWDYTTHGATRIAELLRSAESLGYKYQKK